MVTAVFWLIKGFAQLPQPVTFFSDTIPIKTTIQFPTIFESSWTHLTIDRQAKRIAAQLRPDFIQEIRSIQHEYRLNDWLLYQFLNNFTAQNCTESDENGRELILFSILEQLDFDIELAYQKQLLFIYAASEEKIYNVPYVTLNGASYYNITAFRKRKQVDSDSIYLSDHKIKRGKRLFSFNLKSPPLLTPSVIEANVLFSYKGEPFRIRTVVDSNVKLILKSHPILDETVYFEYPLSEAFQNDFISQMKVIINEKSLLDRISFLLAFTRSGFRYEKDEEAFGESRPLVAEAVFQYSYSDCEDRTALFFQLAKQLIGLPMIIIAFEDHVTVGIAIPNFEGEHVLFEGKAYFICDPTGPNTSSEMGVFPYGYSDMPFEIILSSD